MCTTVLHTVSWPCCRAGVHIVIQTPWATLALQDRSAGGIFHGVFISTKCLCNIWVRMWLLLHFVVWLLYCTSELSGEMGVETLALFLLGCLLRREFRHCPHVSCSLSPWLLCSAEHTAGGRLPPRKNSFISFKSLLECWWKICLEKKQSWLVYFNLNHYYNADKKFCLEKWRFKYL